MYLVTTSDFDTSSSSMHSSSFSAVYLSKYIISIISFGLSVGRPFFVPQYHYLTLRGASFYILLLVLYSLSNSLARSFPRPSACAACGVTACFIRGVPVPLQYSPFRFITFCFSSHKAYAL